MIAEYGLVNPLEVAWVLLMAGIALVECRLLYYARGDRRFVQEHHIDHGAEIMVEGDVTDLRLRLSGTVALLLVGVVSLFTPQPLRESARVSQAVGLALFLYFGIERLVYDLWSYRRRRKLLGKRMGLW